MGTIIQLKIVVFQQKNATGPGPVATAGGAAHALNFVHNLTQNLPSLTFRLQLETKPKRSIVSWAANPTPTAH